MKHSLLLTAILFFTFSCDGDNDITFQEKEEASFNLSVNAKNTEVYATDEIPIKLTLQVLGEMKKGITYDLTFDSPGISSSLVYAGTEYIPGDIIKGLSGESIDAILKTVDSGESDVIFTISTCTGQVTSGVLSLKVKQTDFSFNVSFDNNEDYINDLTPISLNIKKKGLENLTYKAYFKNVNGGIRLLGSDQFFKQNELINIGEGNNHGEFRGKEIKDAEIEFIVEASNGVTHSQKVKFNILSTDFDVSIEPNTISSFYLFPAYFKISIFPPKTDYYLLEYTMRYESNIPYSINLELFDIENTKGSAGTYDFGTRNSSRCNLSLLGSIQPTKGSITFIITDSNGVEVRKTIDVDFRE